MWGLFLQFPFLFFWRMRRKSTHFTIKTVKKNTSTSKKYAKKHQKNVLRFDAHCRRIFLMSAYFLGFLNCKFQGLHSEMSHSEYSDIICKRYLTSLKSVAIREAQRPSCQRRRHQLGNILGNRIHQQHYRNPHQLLLMDTRTPNFLGWLIFISMLDFFGFRRRALYFFRC